VNSKPKPRRESPLILFRFVLAVGIAVALTPLAARADVTLGIGGAPGFGKYRDIDGSAAHGGRPAPIVDLDVRAGLLELHGESIPYQATPYYGDPFNPSTARLSTYAATLRAYDRGTRLAFGIGYGAILVTTYRNEPAGTLASEARGVRLELHHRTPISAHTTFELSLGSEPDLHGAIRTTLGIEGAAVLTDTIAGARFDASALAVVGATRSLSFAYGVRYANTTLRFARSNALVVRDAEILPFAEMRVHL